MKSIISLLSFIAFTCVAYGQDSVPTDIQALLDKNICSVCHKLDEKLIGPSYKELASKGYSEKEIAELIVTPIPANWPDYPPMAPMPHLDKGEVKKIAKWIYSLSSE